MSPRDARGFTLLEVLVAVFIMALVISFAFQAYQGIAGAYERVSQVSTRDRAARILLDRMERELVGAVMVQREEGADPLLHPYLFYAAPRAFEDAAGFELRFVTQTPLRTPGSPPAALALVTYATVPSPSGVGLALLRQEEPLPSQAVKQVEWTAPQTVADGIATFVAGFTGEAVAGGDAWDSTGVEQLDQLPLAVDLAVSLWETGPDGSPWPGAEQTRAVSLPVRPFRLAPDADPDAAQADCGEGVTVAACFERFATEIASASPSLQTAIHDALAQTPDGCWSPDAPSAALERLKVLMSGLPGFDGEACP